MSLASKDLQRIAELAKLAVSTEDLAAIGDKLNRVLALNEQLMSVDTKDVEPMSHPLDLSQPLRPDVVTEPNQRELFQKIAPLTKAGLYLVPQVIETE